MEEVWTFLDQENDQIMEVTSNIVDSLNTSIYSLSAKTEGAKFLELF